MMRKTPDNTTVGAPGCRTDLNIHIAGFIDDDQQKFLEQFIEGDQEKGALQRPSQGSRGIAS